MEQLFYGIKHNDADLVNQSIPMIDYTDEIFRRIIFYIIHNGGEHKSTIFRPIIEALINQNISNDILHEGFMVCIANRQIGLIKEFVLAGFDINSTKPYSSPIISSIILGDISLLSCLIELGINVNSKDKPLKYAIRNSFKHKNGLDMVHILLNAGAISFDVFIQACEYSRFSEIELCSRYKVDPTLYTKNNETALSIVNKMFEKHKFHWYKEPHKYVTEYTELYSEYKEHKKILCNMISEIVALIQTSKWLFEHPDVQTFYASMCQANSVVINRRFGDDPLKTLREFNANVRSLVADYPQKQAFLITRLFSS